MEHERKLTYYKLCLLLKQGKFEEIPSGYKIKWVGGNEPNKVLDTEILGSNMKFTNNDFAVPEKIKIVGTYSVHVPSPFIALADEEELLDFGDVWVSTDFTLTELKFMYENESSVAMLHPYIARHFGYYGREPIKKKDIVFSADFDLGNSELKVFNAMIKTYESDENNAVVIDFIYDYFLLIV